MDPIPPAAHAGHDELLIVRLYGGDVSDAERARAVVLVSECSDCGSLFADLAAITAATAGLAVPPRPRDFSLTEADAARLRGKARPRWRVLGLGLRRSMGGSLAALAILGLILTGTTSVLGGASSSAAGGNVLSPQRLAAPAVAGAVPAASAAGSVSDFGPSSLATAAPAGTFAAAFNANPPTASPAPLTNIATSGAQAASPSTGPHDLAVASAAVAQGAMDGGSGATKSTEATGSASGGTDARLVWLVGFVALLVLGLGLVVLPVRRRGGDRGARS